MSEQRRDRPPLLSVEGVSVDIAVDEGVSRVVDGVSLWVDRAESVGLVGESGSGKSMTALAIVGLLPRAARVSDGAVRLEGEDLLAQGEEAVAAVRGRRIGLIFQNARSALNPIMRVGPQITRVAVAHQEINKRAAESAAMELLARAGIGDPARVYRSYPHQLSGGMAQRAYIAAVLAGRPDMLIADEPTTGLDVTTEVQIFDLLQELRRDLHLGLLLITHDLAVVAENCDRVVVMHAGHSVEMAPVRRLFANPLHPYTRELLSSMPRLGEGQRSTTGTTGPAPEARPEGEGCRYFSRCGQRMDRCAEPILEHLRQPEPGHTVLCRLYD